MKTLTLITLFAILSITSPSFSRIPDSDLPAYIAPYTENPITEDGKLDEPIWQQAKWSRDFAWIDTGKPLALQTRFKCIYSPYKLSFALEMEVSTGDPVLINPDSSWQHYPCPLRIAFNKIFTDSKNRVWAAFVGGFIMVENGKPRVFTEPAGMGAFTVSSIGETASGSIVASCNVLLGTYYNSGRDTGYLLIYKNGKWKKLGYPEGLPGFPNPLTRYGSKLLVGTSAGVYEFIE